jgi:hypothetical protein
MLKCPECQYTSEQYKTVHKHFRRKHPDTAFVRGSIIQVVQEALIVSEPPVRNQVIYF